MTLKTDTSEKGLEERIIRALMGRTDVLSPEHKANEASVPVTGGTGWLLGDNELRALDETRADILAVETESDLPDAVFALEHD